MKMFKSLLATVSLLGVANAYWLMGIEDFITTERIDPIVNPGKVSGHVHSVLGGSNFRFNTTTAQLRESECTSIPIPQDKSNYWFPHMYFQWKNGSFTSLNGGAVIYYLFSGTSGATTAFPDDFRMISGDPTLRSYNPSSFAQQAVTFLCLDFNGVTTKHNEFPAKECPSGIRAQINFPSCWDGKNVDSVDHKSHVSFLSTGPDSGSCSDPKFPITLPRIFIEVYWASNDFDSVRSQAMNTSQPFVFSHGDSTGYGYHADYMMGWDKGVLQGAVNNCHCNDFGDPTCCVQQGIFDMNQGKTCRITKSVDEQTTGTLPALPGNNPVTGFGPNAAMKPAAMIPAILGPVVAYTTDQPPSGSAGKVLTPAAANPAASSSGASTGSSPSSGSSTGASTGSSPSSGSSSSGSSSSPSGASSGSSSTGSTGSGSSGASTGSSSSGSSGSSSSSPSSGSSSSGSSGSSSSSPSSGSSSSGSSGSSSPSGASSGSPAGSSSSGNKGSSSSSPSGASGVSSSGNKGSSSSSPSGASGSSAGSSSSGASSGSSGGISTVSTGGSSSHACKARPKKGKRNPSPIPAPAPIAKREANLNVVAKHRALRISRSRL